MKQILTTAAIVMILFFASAGTKYTPTYSRGWETLKVDSVSNASALTIDLTLFPAYKKFRVSFYNVYPATTGDDIGIRFSKDGSTYDNSSGNYLNSWNYDISNAASGGDGQSTSTYGVFMKVVDNTAARAGRITFEIYNPLDTRYYPRIEYEAGYGDRWSSNEIHYTGQITRGTAQATKKMQLIASTGNVYAISTLEGTK